MTSAGGAQRLPVVATMLLALMLMILPVPEWAATFRPDWVVLVFVYWAMMLPRTWSVGWAWLIGLCLDIAQGAILGQHAMALSLVVFMTVRFHLLMRVFPISQLTATVFALLALYQFLLFWTNGIAGVAAPTASYWGPVITGTVLWPVVSMFLSPLRARIQLGR